MVTGDRSMNLTDVVESTIILVERGNWIEIFICFFPYKRLVIVDNKK